MAWRYLKWIVLCATVLVAYSNVYQNDFVYDDEFLIQKNMNIREWSGIGRSFLMSSTGGAGGVDAFYRPMQGVLYTFVYQISDLQTTGYHLLNILLHLASAVLIFLLGRRLNFSELGSFLAALLWAVHPVHTEAVTYMSATADPLYTLFLLAGLCLAAPEFSWKKILLACPLFILSLMSKETAIVFPALLIACIFLMSKKRWQIKSYISTIPAWAIAILYLILRKTVLNFNGDFDFYKSANLYSDNFLYRLYTFFATLPSYVRLLFWPLDLQMDHAFPVFTQIYYLPVLLGIALLMTGVGLIWRERKDKRPVWSFAVLWFLAAHAPHMGVLLPVNSFFLEHWLYLPCIGFFVVTADSLASLSYRKIVWAASAAVVAALMTVTLTQNKIWATPISLYTHILSLNPSIARIHNNLAMAYSDKKDFRLAIEHYRKAIELEDRYPQSRHNLGLVFINVGDVPAAIEQFKKALEMDPNFYHSAHVLAQIYQQLGDQTQAQAYAKQAAEARAKFPY